MTTEFRMPSLGADMETGTLVQWLKKPGDLIKHGEPIAVVDTQKGAIDIECYQEGKLLRYLADIGTSVPVGTPLAELEETGDTGPAIRDAALPSGSPAPQALNRLWLRRRLPRRPHVGWLRKSVSICRA
jgi:pyruvate dehydrogenase E2 component (dihydrolipoamide acetyltransferase)